LLLLTFYWQDGGKKFTRQRIVLAVIDRGKMIKFYEIEKRFFFLFLTVVSAVFLRGFKKTYNETSN
jgi:hypothetical protein